MGLIIRQIREEDNQEVASLIRTVLKEHGVDKPGTVYYDPTTDDLFNLFKTEKSIYWIAVKGNKIVGACGVFPTQGLPDNCAELVKLYVLPEFRGQQIGLKLMETSFDSAKKIGYKSLYLETLPELTKAVGLYESLGFNLLEHSLGDSGHFACKVWMLKAL